MTKKETDPDVFAPFLPGKVGFKKEDTVCFCFGHTRNDIETDYLKNGRSTILAEIITEKKTGGCDCATKNPKRR